MSRIAPRPKYLINTKPFDKAETTHSKHKKSQTNNLRIMQLNSSTKMRRCKVRNYKKENVSIEPELTNEQCQKKDRVEKQNAINLIKKSIMLLFEAKEKDPEVADPVVQCEPSDEEENQSVSNNEKKSKTVTMSKKKKCVKDPKYETLRPLLIQSPRQSQVIYKTKAQAVAIVNSPRPLKRFNTKNVGSPKKEDEAAQVDTMPELHENTNSIPSESSSD